MVRAILNFVYDAIIVGASVAGASSAALLGRRGFGVLLLDRAKFPRPKICGEGLMPAGVRILEGFGLAVAARLAGAKPFTGLRFHLSSGRSLELDFRERDSSIHGLAMRRESLDELLLRHACAQPGVRLREGFNVRGFQVLTDRIEVHGESADGVESFQGRVLIGADGIRSRFPRALGLQSVQPTPGRFALRGQFARAPGQEGPVDVYCARSSEAYVAPMDGGGARVTLLLDRKPRVCGDARTLYRESLAAFPRLGKRLGGADPIGDVEATSPVSRRLERCHADRVLLAGDAAGACDPVTGQGMTVALRDALLMADFLGDRLTRDRLTAPDLQEYSRLRDRHFLVSFNLARNLLFVLRRPWVADHAAKAVARNSRLRMRLLALATETQPQPPLTPLENLRLLFGF